MIHSIISTDDIFCTEEAVKTEYRRVGGGIVELRGGEFFRLHSTDPYLYISRAFFPYGTR